MVDLICIKFICLCCTAFVGFVDTHRNVNIHGTCILNPAANFIDLNNEICLADCVVWQIVHK